MEQKVERNPAVGWVLRASVAFIIIAATSAAFVIAFAAIIYKGPMTGFLGPGIGLALLGAVFMGLVGAALYSYSGTICQPQDVTTILLAGAVGTLVAGRSPAEVTALWPTVLALMVATPLAVGVLTYLAGRLRAGILARVIPYPVIGGFLAASGYMLVSGALSMTLGPELDSRGLAALLAPDLLADWLPWVAAGAAMVAAIRWTGSEMVLPLGLIAVSAAFYVVLAMAGMDLETAQRAGYMLGPFREQGLLPTDAPMLLLQADWAAVLAQAPTVAAIAALTMLGALLNSSGTEMALERELDVAQDLRATGLSNIAGGLGGGLTGYQLLGETIFAGRLGLTGPIAGVASAAGSGAVLVFGGGILELFPVGLFAAVISFLGFDLLLTWLWDERRRLTAGDYGIVWLILLLAAAVGFLEAFGFGMLFAALVFILSYARIDVVRFRSTAAERRSRVERGDAARAHLAAAGDEVVILELSGFLFFGTSNRLAAQVGDELAADRAVRWMIIDFSRVRGLDASAVFALIKIGKMCRRAGVRLVFSGVAPDLLATYLRRAEGADKAELSRTLDDALERYEDERLRGLDHAAGNPGEDDVVARLGRALDDGTAPGALGRVRLAPGEVLIEEGSESTDAFILLSGRMRAEIATKDGERLRVARFLPGAPIGEMAFYAGHPRSATIVAETDADLIRVAPEALSRDAPELANLFHLFLARQMARRLGRMTRLLRHAGL